MSVKHLDKFFRPTSVAFVGAGGREHSVGRVLGSNLFAGGFDGPVIPIDPKATAVHGVLAYPSVAALPIVPDLAVIAAPAAEAPALIAQFGERGTRAAVVVSSDFERDSAEAGASLRKAMLEAARRHDLRLIGPACLGIVVPPRGLNASYASAPARNGDLAFVTQSGSIMNAMLDWGASRGVGFSMVASLGDMTDVDVGDVLDHLAYDATTRSILVYIERITAPRQFLSAARAVARLKPVIIFRPAAVEEAPLDDADGQPLIEADVVYDAAFRRAGTLPVNRIGDLVAAAQTLATGLRITGERMAILANGRGLCTSVADIVRQNQGHLAALSADTGSRLDALLPAGWGRRNPINLFADAGAERYRQALQAVLDDDAVDLVLATLGPTATGDRLGAARAVAETLGSSRKPGIAVWLGGNDDGEALPLFHAEKIPVFDGAEAAVVAVGQLVGFCRNQEMLTETPASLPELFERDTAAARAILDRARGEGRAQLSEPEAKAVLAAYGVATSGDAGSGRAEPLRIAVAVDAAFGPVIIFGRGNVPAGMIVDRAVGLPPLNLTLAKLLMSETRAYAMLEGRGDAMAQSREELALALVKISQIVCELPQVSALDIDPLRVGACGVVAEHCRMRICLDDAGSSDRLAIRPYPRELEKEVETRRGHRLLLRPIRPEDEPALQAFVRGMPPEDIRLRFFAPLKDLDHRFAARLTQIDYHREMALVLVDPADPAGGIWGVMRILADADQAAAEYAGAVRSDLKGLGLGRLLMEEIIAYARRAGIGEVWGSVLAENAAMLALARKLGFTLGADPEDRSVVHVSLPLTSPSGGGD